MKILLISLNFHPEDTAIGHYSTETALFLKSKGCEVTVIAGFPYYPQWKIWSSYSYKPPFLSEYYKGIRIIRFKQYVPENPNFVKRVFHIISFTIGNMINVFRAGKHDIVIAIVPFLTSIFLAKIHNLFFGSKTWTHVQDFEIEALKNSGVSTKGSWSIKLLQKMERKLLLESHRVSTISPQMIKYLKGQLIGNPYLFPNFIDLTDFQRSNSEKHPYCKEGKFNILYSGNIGEKQDWQLFVDLAKRYKDHDFLHFIIVGDGSKKNWLIRQLEMISNISFYNPIPLEDLPNLLKSVNLHLLFQKKSILNAVMPSKLLGMLASNKPMIICANSASGIREIINDSNAGYCLSDYDIESIANAINDLIEKNIDESSYPSNGLDYVNKDFSKEKVLNDFYLKICETFD